jgi:hypothetical protein
MEKLGHSPFKNPPDLFLKSASICIDFDAKEVAIPL